MRDLALLPLALLAACGSPPPPIAPPPERVLVEPPEPLMRCAGAPVVPDAETQREVAEYLVRLESAGADCREKLAAIRDLIERQKENEE